MSTVRAIAASDFDEVRAELVRHWGSTGIWSLGRCHQADALPGFVAEIDGGFAGLITINDDPGGWQCEVITLSSRAPGRGTGRLLLAAAERRALELGCSRLYLTTTNDNARAIRFYQLCGWRFAALHRGAVDAVRLRQPALPLHGLDGIPIHDEIEFEKWL